MAVPDNTSPPSASTRASQLAPGTGDLSLSQSISASASDLKRPASAASSVDDSQTLSRTKTAKAHYSKAARAFLAKDLQTALVQSQHAVDLLASANQLGTSLTASSFFNDDLDLQKLLEKVAILRLTVFTQIYTDKAYSASFPDKLTQAKQQSASEAAAIDRVLLLLSKQPQSLISHLWFEALRLCSQTSGESDAPSLDPTSETIHLAIELPASVISSAVLAALRLDALQQTARIGTNAARLIAEWYLASFSSAFGASAPTQKAAAAYEKMVGLYSLHVLASRLGEWEYAREFVGYSSLPESIKFGLLEQINEAQIHLTNQSEREQEAMASAQKAYAEEKAKRAAEEKQAKEAAASAASSAGKAAGKVGGKARDLASGIGNFLSGSKKDADGQLNSFAAAGASSQSAPQGARESPSSGSGSESGSRSQRQRSQSPAYFSPRNGPGESGSSSSTSPAISPGSTRSVDSTSKHASASGAKQEPKSDRRSARRGSSLRSSDYEGGNESSTSAASNHSRRSARKETAEKTASKEQRFKDDTSYASTRAHLSRYMEGDHHHASSSTSGRKKGERQVSRSAWSANSILSTITSMFDLRKASQSRNYLMTAIVMMFVFFRVARRQPASSGNAKVSASTRRNAAARDARSKLVGRNGRTAGLLDFNWLFLFWAKVLNTIKMGTQVTYL